MWMTYEYTSTYWKPLKLFVLTPEYSHVFVQVNIFVYDDGILKPCCIEFVKLDRLLSEFFIG